MKKTNPLALSGAFALLLIACSGKFVETSEGATGGASATGGSRAGTGGSGVGTGGSSSSTGGNGACDLALSKSDGKCELPAQNPCRLTDPDCVPVNCSLVDCRPVDPATDGVCGAAATFSDCCGWSDVDCGNPGVNCTAVRCAAISEVSDGTCSRPATDCCRFQDPDCTNMCANVACPTIGPAPLDGVCSQQAPAACCGFSDPDCGAKYNCDVSQVACDLFVQCEAGKVPTSNGTCYGPCVERQLCTPGTEPPNCAAVDCAPPVARPFDGYCPSPNPTAGCCGFSDPDCANVVACRTVACAEFIEVSDGQCNRKFADCCRIQDPDCSSVGGLARPAACANAGVCAPLQSTGTCDLTPDNCCWGADPDCPL